jgi:hypothetical protein
MIHIQIEAITAAGVLQSGMNFKTHSPEHHRNKTAWNDRKGKKVFYDEQHRTLRDAG